MEFISIPVVVGIITYGIYKLFELFACRRERLNIIEKLSDSRFLDTAGGFSLPDYSHPRISYGALKGGCLLMGIGLGLLVGFIICATCLPSYFENEPHWQLRQMTNIIYGACVLVFGGAGLLTAFLIELKFGKKKA